MRKRQWWNRLAFSLARGLLLVLLAVILQWGGYLDGLDNLLKDVRVRHCQTFPTPPAPELVHLDVDDTALAYIGRWPWSKQIQARIVDEIALARPKLLATDLLLADKDNSDKGGESDDGEKQLAASLSNLGCALLPMSFTLEAHRESRVQQLIQPLLIEDPERTQEQCLDLLKSQGITSADLRQHSDDSFLEIRDRAFYERVWREVLNQKNGPIDREMIERTMLPNSPEGVKTLLEKVFDEQFTKVMREREMLRFTLPMNSGEESAVNAVDPIPPLLSIGQAAAFSGFCDYLHENIEGTVRSIPLVVQYRDRLIPQMDLAAACAELGVDIHAIRLTRDSVTLPRPSGDIVIPVTSRESSIVGRAGMLMEIPMFGKPGDFLTMYDYPYYKSPARHMSAFDVWSICQTLDSIRFNQQAAHDALTDTIKKTGWNIANVEKVPAREAAEKALPGAIAKLGEFAANMSSDPDQDEDTRQRIAACRIWIPKLQSVATVLNQLRNQLTIQRRDLVDRLHNKVVYFGGTATGLGDLRPTPLFGRCPGVIVHGAIYNAIVTGRMWRRAPDWTGPVLTAALGLITMLMVLTLRPALAFAASLLLAVGYLAFNGYYLFAHNNWIVEAAGPSVAILLVWSGLTLTNFMTEITERSRITRRFRNYVDPAVVDFVIEHPELTRFDGERREMTLGFSDLAGFTTLTDELGEQIVPLLSEYMEHMLAVIDANNGRVSQMSGDGIFFFYGAPLPDEHHATNGVLTALEMHRALTRFNETLQQTGRKPLAMRIGISTGEVIFGDTGARDRSALTAIGANVNLASRLESANKVFGTQTLITARTAELIGNEFLLRPIANLRVVGKLDTTVVYEPMCRMSDATEQDRRLAEWTTRLFNLYCDGDFENCMSTANEFQLSDRNTTLLRFYAQLAAEHRNGSAKFEHQGGLIHLTEK